ncbi:hypothetical protein [Streptomyces sp. V1I6]|uniref:DUF6896 domain-containing protein n=1 Tax=Streptomyces sp. V1I6 TaxID=3042273 RepID=UPI002782C910|nr:hypothetical protein [Streptomyces sp. V1I6]MDQ0840861.1 hypothetical protein [Streptomyces sp. V1I6]
MTARQPPSPRAMVLDFVAALETAGTELREALPQVERLADLLALARSGQIGRRGRAGGYEYSVHGAGCRLTSSDGVDIDVDFVDGAEVFDLWRLRCYAQSLPTPADPPPEDLLAAISSLDGLLTEVRPGWFAVTRRHTTAVTTN